MEIISSYIKGLSLTMLLLLAACGQDLDLTGMIYSETEVNGRFTQSMEWNNTHPERIINLASDDYSLAFAGDCHVGETAHLMTLLDSAGMPDVSALILCGDNTTGKQEDYDKLKSILDTVTTVRYYLTTGNHDLYHAGWPAFYAYFGASVFPIEIRTPNASDLIIVMDNSSGTIGSKQLEWVRTTLNEKRGNFRHCIVACHVNFFRNRFTISTNPIEEEIWALIDLFAGQRVDMVITGHDHERYVEEFGHTTYITMDAVKDAEPQTSWLKLQVQTDSLKYQFIGF